VVTEEQRRGSITAAFIDVFDAPQKCDWGGNNGTVSIILEHFRMPRGSRDMVSRDSCEHDQKSF